MTARTPARAAAGRRGLAFGLWVGLLLGFPLAGWSGRLAAWAALPPPAPRPWTTTDAWLRPSQLPQPSQTIIEAFHRKPPGAVLFVAEDSAAALAYYTYSYLLWPRPVVFLLCPPGAPAPRLAPAAPGPYAAVIYHQLAPPAGLSAAGLGATEQVAAPASPQAAWATFCP